MSYTQNFLKGIIQGIRWGRKLGLKGDTRSLDYRSFERTASGGSAQGTESLLACIPGKPYTAELKQ